MTNDDFRIDVLDCDNDDDDRINDDHYNYKELEFNLLFDSHYFKVGKIFIDFYHFYLLLIPLIACRTMKRNIH